LVGGEVAGLEPVEDAESKSIGQTDKEHNSDGLPGCGSVLFEFIEGLGVKPCGVKDSGPELPNLVFCDRSFLSLRHVLASFSLLSSRALSTHSSKLPSVSVLQYV